MEQARWLTPARHIILRSYVYDDRCAVGSLVPIGQLSELIDDPAHRYKAPHALRGSEKPYKRKR